MVRHVLLCALGMWNPQSIKWGPQGEAGKISVRRMWAPWRALETLLQQSSSEGGGIGHGQQEGQPPRPSRETTQGSRQSEGRGWVLGEWAQRGGRSRGGRKGSRRGLTQHPVSRMTAMAATEDQGLRGRDREGAWPEPRAPLQLFHG